MSATAARRPPALASLVLSVVAVSLGGCPPSGGSGPHPDAHYVGVEVCRECHPAAWRVWLGSRHARSVVALQTGLAAGIAARTKQPLEGLPDNPECLRCHGVGAAPGDPNPHGPGSRPDEAVTCEACHGPASLHVDAARQRRERPGLVASLRHPVRSCPDCHRPKASHEHDLAEPFDAERFDARIKHGLEAPPVVDWLPGGPGRPSAGAKR